MGFADPQVCPACRGRLDGSPRCPVCGLDLTSAEVTEAWQALLHADALVARAIELRDAGGPPTPPVSAPATQSPQMPPPQMPPMAMPNYPAPPVPERPDRSWSVGTILLTLGAFGLVVAALIFVSRSWVTIGLAGKAAILGAATLAVGAAAAWATRRTLRASAEALWAVFLVMLAVDVGGARGEGLAGLDGVEWAWVWVVIGVLITIVSAGVLIWARGPIGRELWVPGIGAVAGQAIAASAAAWASDLSLFWGAFVGLVAAGLIGLALRVTGSRRIAIGARIVVAVFFAFAACAALGELFDHPSFDEVAGGGHGLPMLLVIVAAIVVGVAVPSARVVMAALPFFGLFALVGVPAGEERDTEGAILTVAGFATLPALAVLRGTNAWVKGVRVGVLAPLLGLVATSLWWTGALLLEAGEAVDDPWFASATERFPVTDVNDVATWVTCLVAVALVVAFVAAAKWPEVPAAVAPWVLVVAVLLALPGFVTAGRPSWLGAAGVFTVAGAVAVVAHARDRGQWAPSRGAWSAGAVAAVLAGSYIALASQGASVVAWGLGGLVFAGLFLIRGSDASWIGALGIAPLLAGAAAAGADLAGADRFGTPLAAAVVVLALTVGCALMSRSLPKASIAAEIIGGVTLLVALIALEDGPRAAAVWTVVGVAACVVAAVVDQRRGYVVPGVMALVVAYVLLIVDSEFTFIEAYTLPIGLALLAAGVWWMRRRPETNTWASLGAGLLVCLLPSLPQAMVEPTEWRALLLFAGAVVALGVGAKLDWQAPFVLGCLVAAVILLCNIGPYANAAPRVVVIAVVSTVLVAIGITWEDRVRDGRRVMAFVKAMR